MKSHLGAVELGAKERARQAELERRAACYDDLLAALLWCKSQGFASYTYRIPKQNEAFCDAVDRLNAAIDKATGAKP